MTNRLSPLLALAPLAATGCVRTYQVPADRPQLLAPTVDGNVTTTDGVRGGYLTDVDPGRVTIRRDGRDLTIPIAEVESIEVIDHGRGALLGLGYGAAIGGSLGLVAGFADGDSDCGPEAILCQDISAEGKALAYGLVLGAVGGAIGAGIGGLFGTVDVYQVERTRVTVSPTSVSLRHSF